MSEEVHEYTHYPGPMGGANYVEVLQGDIVLQEGRDYTRDGNVYRVRTPDSASIRFRVVVVPLTRATS